MKSVSEVAPTLEAEREAFEAWHRSKFETKHSTGQPTRDMHNGIYAENYGPKDQQLMWEVWQAARTAAPVAEGVALPPLPEPISLGWNAATADVKGYTAEQVRQAQRDAVAADRWARAMTEVLNNPPYGEPDLYSRLHTALTDQIEVAKAAGKAREWFDAARSLVDYLASQAGFIAAAPSPLPPQEEAK